MFGGKEDAGIGMRADGDFIAAEVPGFPDDVFFALPDERPENRELRTVIEITE